MADEKTWSLGAILSFKTRGLVAGLATAEQRAKALTGSLDSLKETGKATARDLGIIAAGATALGAVLFKGGQAAAEWDMGMRKISTLLTGREMDVLPQLSGELDALSRSTGVAAADLQNAAFQAISAGVSAGDSAAFMGVAAKTSVGGFVDMTTAVDGLTTVLNAYGMSSTEAVRVSDAFFVANKRGKTTAGELAASLGQVAPVAAAAGLDMETLVSSVARITKVGIRTPEAVTGLKAALQGIIAPADSASKAAKKLGLDLSVAGMKAAGGFVPFLAQVAEKTGGNVEQLSELFTSVEALNAVASMTSKTGLADLNAILQETRTSVGVTEEAFQKMAASPQQKMARLRETLNSMLRTIGTAAQPVFDSIGQMATQVGTWLDQNRTKLEASFKVVAGDVQKLTNWIAGDGAKAALWVLEHFDTIWATSKQILSTWAEIRTVQLAIAALQTVMAAGSVARGGAGAAGLLSSLGITGAAGALSGAMNGAAAGTKALGAAAQGAAAETTAVMGGGGVVGTLFGPASQGIKTFGGALGVAAAGIVGWNIGQWLNSIGADELVYRGLRAVLPGGGSTTAEVNAEEAARMPKIAEGQRWARLASIARRTGDQVGEFNPVTYASGKLGWNEAAFMQGGKVDPLLEDLWTATRIAMGGEQAPQTFSARASELADVLEGAKGNGRERTDLLQTLHDMAAGSYGGRFVGKDAEWVVANMEARTEKMIAATEAQKAAADAMQTAAKAGKTVVVPAPKVELDGRKVGRGLAEGAIMDAQRGGAEGVDWSPSARTRILRSGILVNPAVQTTVGWT